MVADPSKFFDAAQALSQSLSQWALLIIGGSLVVVVGTDYYRPPTRRMRYPYLLFVPAWGFLAASAWEGMRAQGVYVAYLLLTDDSHLADYRVMLNNFTAAQIEWLEWALASLGLWLIFYVFWWVFAKDVEEEKKA